MDKQLKIIENRLQQYENKEIIERFATAGQGLHTAEKDIKDNSDMDKDLIAKWLAEDEDPKSDEEIRELCKKTKTGKTLFNENGRPGDFWQGEFWRSFGFQWASMFGGGQEYADKNLQVS
jgi:hypothetical protein